MNQRAKALEEFEKTGIDIEKTPDNWFVWKRAFDKGVKFKKELKVTVSKSLQDIFDRDEKKRKIKLIQFTYQETTGRKLSDKEALDILKDYENSKQ